MILFDEKGRKVISQKTNRPKLKSGDWDSVNKSIDGIRHILFCSNKSSRSYFYFQYNEQWYKMNMYQDSVGDLFENTFDLYTKSESK